MRFTAHATQRLAQRGITREDVAAVLSNPTRTARIRPNATSYFGRALDGRAIVVSLADNPPDLVITVFLPDEE